MKRKKVFFHLGTTITTPWSREKNTLFTNEERKMFFFSFIHYHHYAMTKSDGFFFYLPTTIPTLWSREKKVFFHLATTFTNEERKMFFFSFSYYDHCAMMKREKSFFNLGILFSNEARKLFFFIYSLRSLRHDQERKLFFHLATTITTPWSREKKVFFSFCYYDHYAMIKRKKLFSFSHFVH